MINNTFDEKFQKMKRRLEVLKQQFNFVSYQNDNVFLGFFSIEISYPQQKQFFYMSEQIFFHTVDTFYYTNTGQFRAKKMRYFDLEYQSEQRIASHDFIVNVGKHVYYRDVYIFVDRFKDLVIRYDIIYIIALYLRGSTLI